MFNHKSQWWFEPQIPKRFTPRGRHKNHLKPTEHTDLKKPSGSFAPSSKWVNYNRLQPIDGGYIVPLYGMADIRKRYGLSIQSTAYIKKNILPEPYGIMRRRSSHAHHYSKFVLMAMDCVLRELQRQGKLYFLKEFTDHVELLHTGVEWLSDYYERKAEHVPVRNEDRHGVIWYER
jgi:hypothetical protein